MDALGTAVQKAGSGLMPDTAEQTDAESPTAPANVVATVVCGAAVCLGWEEPSDNVGVAGYRIYKDDVEIGTSEETGYRHVLSDESEA